jgi:hypothetical protein
VRLQLLTFPVDKDAKVKVNLMEQQQASQSSCMKVHYESVEPQGKVRSCTDGGYYYNKRTLKSVSSRNIKFCYICKQSRRGRAQQGKSEISIDMKKCCCEVDITIIDRLSAILRMQQLPASSSPKPAFQSVYKSTYPTFSQVRYPL